MLRGDIHSPFIVYFCASSISCPRMNAGCLRRGHLLRAAPPPQQFRPAAGPPPSGPVPMGKRSRPIVIPEGPIDPHWRRGRKDKRGPQAGLRMGKPKTPSLAELIKRKVIVPLALVGAKKEGKYTIPDEPMPPAPPLPLPPSSLGLSPTTCPLNTESKTSPPARLKSRFAAALY